MPWYFIDISNKFFLPGRLGVSFDKVVGKHAISFEEFKKIYKIYLRHQKQK